MFQHMGINETTKEGEEFFIDINPLPNDIDSDEGESVVDNMEILTEEDTGEEGEGFSNKSAERKSCNLLHIFVVVIIFFLIGCGLLTWKFIEQRESFAKNEKALKTKIKGIEKIMEDLQKKASKCGTNFNEHASRLASLGQLDEALEYYDKAIQENPNEPSTHINRGDVLKKLNRCDEAHESYNNAEQVINQHAQRICLSRGTLMERSGEFKKALAEFDKAIEIDPNNYEPLYRRGNVLVRFERFDKALESYNKAIELNPSNVDVLNNLGNLFLRKNNPGDALEMFEKAIQLDTNKADGFLNRGVAQWRLGLKEEAIQSYEKAIQLNPKDRQALCNHADALMNIDRLDEALESWNKAIALKPNAGLFLDRGNVLERLGRLWDAIESYNKAINSSPNRESPAAHEGVRRANEKLDQQERKH